MAEITMPRLSDTMSEGAVGRWLKRTEHTDLTLFGGMVYTHEVYAVPPDPSQPGSQVTADSSVALEEQHNAQVCHEANQSLNSAQGTQAIDAAIARVRALCHN